ncbi:MAG TPA: RNA polymerase sigma factor region1.1 domain-containing protein, partial [Verrucomicrobiae bacterium]
MKSNKLVSTSNRKTVVRKLKTISFGKGLRSHQMPKRNEDGVGSAAVLPAKTKSATHGQSKLPTKASLGPEHESNLVRAQENLGQIKSTSGVDITEKVKELISLAREQGYLTYEDIDDVLADPGMTAEDVDEIHTRLANLDIEIVDQAEMERTRASESEEEEEKGRLDSMDDPVRMYMRQMGKTPLLTREQEVEICKRIEDAEIGMRRLIYSFGFTAKEHIALAEKLISEPPKERFDRVIVDKKIEGREDHLRALRLLVKNVRALDQQVDEKYAQYQHA